MGEMLRSAGEDFTQRTMNLFLRGKDSDKNNVVLDLEEDEQKVEEVVTTLDIDSVLWTTTKPRVKTNCDLHMVPVITPKAPIAKHNHAYVSILCPPTEEQQRDKDYVRPALSVSQSAIPHTLFAHVGPFTILICFPRMYHKHEYTGKRQNIIPLPVLDVFWDRVVLAALREVVSESKLPYLSSTVEQWRVKGKGGRSGGAGSAFKGYRKTIDSEDFSNLVEAMARIVRKNADDTVLGRFASYYFVVEAKGIKLCTQVSLSSGDSPVRKLCESWPQLDWTFMFDRKNGELLLDLGISFHPAGDCAMVGLWRLDNVLASYHSGGWKTPDIHRLNTFIRYGGASGEMMKEHSRRQGISFRNTYCLAYEASRSKDNQPWFCSDADAYECTPVWYAAVKAKADVYEGARSKSFGVRDEYRCSVDALFEILEKLPTLVCPYCAPTLRDR